MPYNAYYPQTYPQMMSQFYQNQIQQLQSQLPQQMSQQQQTQTIQDGGLVEVPDETVAFNYPTAPGVTVTMIDKLREHLFTKTMGFNQLEKPIFQRYRIIKEDEQNGAQSESKSEGSSNTIDELKAQIDRIQNEYERVLEDIENIKAKMEERPRKKVNAKLARENNEDE